MSGVFIMWSVSSPRSGLPWFVGRNDIVFN